MQQLARFITSHKIHAILCTTNSALGLANHLFDKLPSPLEYCNKILSMTWPANWSGHSKKGEMSVFKLYIYGVDDIQFAIVLYSVLRVLNR